MKRYRDIAGDGGSDIQGQVATQQVRLQARLAAIRAKVAVVSGKGGVGKSAVTANLAAALATRGLAVGVLDADLNGPTLGRMLGVRGQSLRVTADGVVPAEAPGGIRVVTMDLLLPADETPVVWEAPTQTDAHAWRGLMEANAIREFLADTAWGALDVLLLDLPPGADRLPTVAGLVPGLAAVVVTIPSEVSHLVVRKSLTLARESGTPILGLVENMAGYACATCGTVGTLFGGGPGGALTAARHGVPFLGPVPFDPRLAAAADLGRPFVLDHPDAPAGRSLIVVADRLREALRLA